MDHYSLDYGYSRLNAFLLGTFLILTIVVPISIVIGHMKSSEHSTAIESKTLITPEIHTTCIDGICDTTYIYRKVN